jgi:hypothetical protein
LRLSTDKLKHYIDQVNQVLTTLVANKTFCELKPDDIYRWQVKYDIVGKIIIGVPHCVVHVGHKQFEQDEKDNEDDGALFYPFLNSQSYMFVDLGFIIVFHDDLAHVYVLEIKRSFATFLS